MSLSLFSDYYASADLASRSQSVVEERLKAGKQTSQAMQYINALQQQIQAMQQQYMVSKCTLLLRLHVVQLFG